MLCSPSCASHVPSCPSPSPVRANLRGIDSLTDLLSLQAEEHTAERAGDIGTTLVVVAGKARSCRIAVRRSRTSRRPFSDTYHNMLNISTSLLAFASSSLVRSQFKFNVFLLRGLEAKYQHLSMTVSDSPPPLMLLLRSKYESSRRSLLAMKKSTRPVLVMMRDSAMKDPTITPP